MKITKKEFTGPLAKRIKIDQSDMKNVPTILTHPDGIDGVINWWKEYNRKTFEFVQLERIKKFVLLYQHYNIEVEKALEDSMELAWNLALDFVPGFSVVQPEKQGRKVIWTDQILSLLWWQVREMKQNKGYTESRACQVLVHREPWKTRLKDTINKRGHLYKRHQEAKKNGLCEFFEKVLQNVDSPEIEQAIKRLIDESEKPWHDPFRVAFAELNYTEN